MVTVAPSPFGVALRLTGQAPSRARRSVSIAAVVLHLTASLSAQTSIPYSPFAALGDSLATVSDTTTLRGMLRRFRRSDPVRAGVAGLRLGELRVDPDFGEALSAFRLAVRKDPSRPEPWYGLGRAEAGRSQWEMSDRLRLGSRVGVGTLERAANHYLRALNADPRFIPAALDLAQVELSLLDTIRLATACDALRRTVAALAPAPPQLLLALGRLERAAGSLDAATATFERYLALAPTRALALLELGRTLLALGRAEGEVPYYQAAALDDPIATEELRSDLEPLVADSILRQFDRLTGSARAAYLHRFWTARDHEELRPEGERLREHYRRMLFARAHFPLTISRRFYGRLDAYRSGNSEVDDRGIIYIRQGAPSERLRPFIFGVMPNESWHYVRSDGDLLLHFSAGYDQNGGGDLYDYRLVQSVLDLHGAADAPRDQLLLSRQALSPIYSRMLNWGRYGSANVRARERNIGATSITVGTTTDSYELQFKHRLSALADLVSVGRDSRGSLGHFVFGIAAAGASARRVGGDYLYSVRVRLAALDRYSRTVAALDTTIVIRHGRELSEQEWLLGRAQLNLPAGRWSYRAALQQGDSLGVVLPRDSVRVANGDGTTLALSDVALGTPGRAASWVTDAADTVLLAPSALFHKGAEVQIYYEVSGAKERSMYRHQIAVLRPDPSEGKSRRPPLVSLAFDELARGEIIRSRRAVRLQQLKRGNYIVEVRVTAPDGATQLRRRLIRLSDR